MAYTVCHASLKIMCEMLPDIHTMKTCGFLKSRIRSQMIYFSVIDIQSLPSFKLVTGEIKKNVKFCYHQM